LKDKRIFYTYWQPKQKLAGEITLSKDEIDPKVLLAVHEYFPFSRSAEDSFFHCPNWAKMLLYRYFTLNNVKDIIKHFNRGSD
jgi:hypothetical protein